MNIHLTRGTFISRGMRAMLRTTKTTTTANNSETVGFGVISKGQNYTQVYNKKKMISPFWSQSLATMNYVPERAPRSGKTEINLKRGK